MRALLYSAAILFVSLSAVSASAQGLCQKAWTVKAEKQGSFININIRENEAQGPACDLVVKSFDYIEGLKVLSVDVAAVKVCPLDAIAHRTARLQWQLPFGARDNTSLRLVVNGEEAGRLNLNQGTIVFEGGCL